MDPIAPSGGCGAVHRIGAHGLCGAAQRRGVGEAEARGGAVLRGAPTPRVRKPALGFPGVLTLVRIHTLERLANVGHASTEPGGPRSRDRTLGFDRREDDAAKKREKVEWVLLYRPRQGAAVSIIAGNPYPDGMLSRAPPRRDRTTLEGEYVYGVKASYQSLWDRLVGRWRNDTCGDTLLQPWYSCSGNDMTGETRPRSERR